MASAQPGWYPDPSGDVSKLRYWDGAQWTDNYTANPQQQAQATPQQPQAETAQQVQPQVVQVNPGQQTYAGMGNTANVYANTASTEMTYPVSEKDKTLRLIAFIFMCVSLAATCWLILPLAWMIPMTIHTWGIYKGKKANSVAFGVCSLIFASLVAGILLLISEKEK